MAKQSKKCYIAPEIHAVDDSRQNFKLPLVVEMDVLDVVKESDPVVLKTVLREPFNNRYRKLQILSSLHSGHIDLSPLNKARNYSSLGQDLFLGFF